ncbi:MAG TPA: sulfite reductase subunit beta, partial [Niabella sp.]
SDRKQARLKYTIDKMGVDNYREEVEKRCGFQFEPARPYTFTSRKDAYGWSQNHERKWYYTLFIENGRVLDEKNYPLKSGLLKIAETGKANFRFTCNQNLILSDILDEDKAAIEQLLEEHQIIKSTEASSPVRRNSMACVALSTCGLAMAEAQRYLPTLISKIEPLLHKYQLQEEDIIVRMTGCPNGCGRSPNAEIGFVGTSLGKYNLHIGGDRLGARLNTKYKDSLDEAGILETLDNLFAIYIQERNNGETFGDFSQRKWIEAV